MRSRTRRRSGTATPLSSSFQASGSFGFGKDKREARITTEFFVNAIHVMSGANALEADQPSAGVVPQARKADQATQFKTFHNYVALPRAEAFRIEYWALEEAKLQRMPPEREFSRKVVVVVGGGSGIGREVAQQIALRGGHLVVADQNVAGRGRDGGGGRHADVTRDGAAGGARSHVARHDGGGDARGGAAVRRFRRRS